MDHMVVVRVAGKRLRPIACAINAAAVALPPRQQPRRPPSLVSWPLYRLVLVPSLVVPLAAALSLGTAAAPPPPEHPPAVSGQDTANKAGAFVASEHGLQCCQPGSPGELHAADWVASELRRFDHSAHTVEFAADLPWKQTPVPMANVIAYSPGQEPGVIAVIAHRDGAGAATAAGTALLVELGRALAGSPHERGIVLVSTDGGTTGGQGAAEFARTWPLADQIDAAVVVNEIGAPAGVQTSLVVRPDTPRGTSPTVVAAARQAIARATGHPAAMPGPYDQLSGYAVPYTTSEQGPLLAHGLPAVTFDGGGSSDPATPVTELDAGSLGQAGGAVGYMVSSLAAAPSIDPPGPPVLFLGDRVARGWLVEVALVALMAPVVACIFDLTARLRRRRLPLAPGVRAYAWRCSTWIAALLAMWALTFLPGRLLSPVATVPIAGHTAVTTAGLVVIAAVALVWWRFAVRPRIVPVARVTATERTGGLAAGLAGMTFASLLLAAVNPFALVIVLPAAHAWLWLPAAARLGRRAMAIVWSLGLIGPAVVITELWWQQGLGTQTPRVLVAMTASGYLSPAVSGCLALCAAAGCQLAAIVLARYSPAHPWVATVPRGRDRLRPP